ncbi:SDR family NAD(P)-dependent oxidoreductase [Streptomyces sp. NPDC091281]|uniref:SDR family NAD(P)-dependent oxidoreductase n=1 Tax=Streptomyces sp. NPDC091281 TaxID=3365985 RepID=UPI0038187D94
MTGGAAANGAGGSGAAAGDAGGPAAGDSRAGAGRVALVTGGDRGIGFEVARRMVERGDQVIIAAPDAVRLCRAATELGPLAHAVVLDVTDDDSVAAMWAEVTGHWPRVDVLVSCAGVNVEQGGSELEGRLAPLQSTVPRTPPGAGVSVLSVPPALVAATVDTNTLGTLRLARLMVPPMLERGYGRVVTVSSERGSFALMTVTGDAGAPGYQLSKAALNALTVMLAGAVSGDVLVNAVCPGWVRTDMGGPHADRDVAQAAEGILWAVDLPEGGPNGGFFRDGAALSW